MAELQNVSVSITILKGSRLRICQDGGPWCGRTTECISKYKGSTLIRGGVDIAILFLNSFLVRHS